MAKRAKCTRAERAQLDRENPKSMDACAEYDDHQVAESGDIPDESRSSPPAEPSTRKIDELLALLAHHRKPRLEWRPLLRHERDDLPAGVSAIRVTVAKVARDRIH